MPTDRMASVMDEALMVPSIQEVRTKDVEIARRVVLVEGAWAP